MNVFQSVTGEELVGIVVEVFFYLKNLIKVFRCITKRTTGISIVVTVWRDQIIRNGLISKTPERT